MCTRFSKSMVVLAWCAAAPTFSAFSIIMRHDRADADYVELGQRFTAAGRVHPDGGCALIASRWILTAGHVAQSLSPERGRIQLGEKVYGIDGVFLHPDAKGQPGQPPEVDLALVKLRETVEGIEPALLYRKRDEKGKQLFLVGYGDVGDGRSRPRRSDGKRRAATNIVSGVRGGRILMKFDEPPAGTELEGVSGPGDSGGPAFLEKDGSLYIVGISSASMGGRPGRYGVTDVYTRVSSFVEWIDTTLKGNP